MGSFFATQSDTRDDEGAWRHGSHGDAEEMLLYDGGGASPMGPAVLKNRYPGRVAGSLATNRFHPLEECWEACKDYIGTIRFSIAVIIALQKKHERKRSRMLFRWQNLKQRAQTSRQREAHAARTRKARANGNS